MGVGLAPHADDLALCLLLCISRKLKENSRRMLAEQLDVPQLLDALGALPAWLSGIGGATERLDWANTLLAQVKRGFHARNIKPLVVAI
jgi:hypothetical protein